MRALYGKIIIFALYLIDNKDVKKFNRVIQKEIPFRIKNGEICHFELKTVTQDKYHQIHERMKKLFITPQKDTVTLCLPPEWVGKPLVCLLQLPHEKPEYPYDTEFVSSVREESIGYNILQFQRKRRPRKKRLRRKRGGKNRYL